MTDIQSNSVRFVKLHLRDYGIFLGSNELNFDRHRTVIVGRGGTGKSTIVNALAKLGPVKGVKAHVHAENPEMSVEVMTEGNRNLVNEYSRLIFIDCEYNGLPIFGQENPFAGILNHQQWEPVRDEAREIFQAMLFHKPLKMESRKDFNLQTMAAGERICLYYAYTFAFRRVMNLDLPIVLDSPYDRLNTEHRSAVRAFLKEQPCQQILLGSEYQFDKEDKPRYMLDYTKDYSTVIKNMV
jgi:energy-coupling factor transporter ATP-binding protein EcfA2